MSDNQNMPQPGTPEYDKMMKEYYGDKYEFGYRATFGKRLGAFVMDVIFLGIISMLVANSTGFWQEMMEFARENQGNMNFFDPNAVNGELLESVLSFSMFLYGSFIVYWLAEIFLSASIGKLALGLRIASSSRQKAGANQLFIRFVVRHSGLLLSFIYAVTAIEAISNLSSLATLLFIIGAFFVFSDKRQAIHDMVANTAIFNKHSIKEGE